MDIKQTENAQEEELLRYWELVDADCPYFSSPLSFRPSWLEDKKSNQHKILISWQMLFQLGLMV